MALDFYKMLLTADFGATIMSITWLISTPKTSSASKTPNRQTALMKMTLEANQSSSSDHDRQPTAAHSGSSRSFIAEQGQAGDSGAVDREVANASTTGCVDRLAQR